jgi:hypothetical protein
MVSYLLSLTNVVFTWGLRITSREITGFVKTRDRLTCKPLHGSDIVSVDYMANSKVLLYNKRRCVCVCARARACGRGGSHSSSENRLELEILAIVLDDYEKCCSKYHYNFVQVIRVGEPGFYSTEIKQNRSSADPSSRAV